MTWYSDIPDIDNVIGSDLEQIEANFDHLKNAIGQEHAWSDTDYETIGHSFFSNDISIDASLRVQGIGYFSSSVQIFGQLHVSSDVSFSSSLVVGGKIQNVSTPTSSYDAATKSYVDTVAGGGYSPHAVAHVDGTDNINNVSELATGLMTSTNFKIFSHRWSMRFLIGGM